MGHKTLTTSASNQILGDVDEQLREKLNLSESPLRPKITTTSGHATPPDSDSGHERTSSSSASNCSEENFHQDQSDCFEDASDVVLDQHRRLDHLSAGTGQGFGPGKLDDVCEHTKGPAQAASNYGDEAQGEPSLEVRLAETREILRMALSNEFVGAMEICAPRAHRELYTGLAHATLCFLRAALTLEQADLREALESIQQSFEVSQSKRRQVSTASMVMRFLYKPNYNAYTDDEIHAELVNAEAMLMLSLISFLADQSVLCLVRGAFRIRACYQRYKECLYILDHRQEWTSQEAKRHFESGVRMGYGIFNLLMSYLPRRVLKFLEYVGFSGSRTVGVSELDKSIELQDGLRSVFSALVILTYHSYVENLFGLGHYDDAKVEQLNETFLGHYPDSAFFLLFLGRYHQMKGNLPEAIASFEKCCTVQQDWKQFHSICHWEIMWCYASQLDWPQAAHYANLLRQHSKWSPSSYQYQYGTFLYAQLVEDERAGLIARDSEEFARRRRDIKQIIEKVPSLRIRYAGKTIPADKFAITRSEKFIRQGDRLALPALEFLYIWNIFCTLKNSPRQVGLLLERIDSEIEFVKSDGASKQSETQQQQQEEGDGDGDGDGDEETSKTNLIDNLCLMYLLRGMCLKHLSRFDEAESAFAQVIEHEHEIQVDKFLVPHSAMELAILNLQLKRYETSKQYIKMARHNYTGYLMETIVHFRLHAASRLIRIEQQHNELEGSHENGGANPSTNSMDR